MSDDTYYDALGVSKDATRDELRAAYRERVESLEASREGKGVSDATLRANKDETARVRAAWNVLSDPFQRNRYDAQLEAGQGAASGADAAGEIELAGGSSTELTGWRRVFAPPPPRNGSAGRRQPAPPANRRARQPTVVLPPGMTLADNRNRGMALLFDIAVLLLIFIVVSYLVPPLVQSDYRDVYDSWSSLQKKADKASDRASKADDRVSNAEDKVAAAKKKDDSSALADAEDQLATAKVAKKNAHNTADATQKAADKEHEKLSTANVVALVVSGVLMLLYLVPVAVRTGKTIGMWRRNLRVVRADGSPLTFGPALIRYGLPIVISLALYPAMGQLAFIIGLFAVLWGFRDPNKQGIHDKLAKTLVVSTT